VATLPVRWSERSPGSCPGSCPTQLVSGPLSTKFGFGGDEGTRTPGLRDANAALFQLSYIPTGAVARGRRPGAECTSIPRRADPSLPVSPDRTGRPGQLSTSQSGPVPIGLGNGLIAALCWGSTDVMASIAGRRLGSLHVVMVAQLASVAVAILLAINYGVGFPSDPFALFLAALFGAIAAGAYVSFFTALRIGPLSVVSPVVAAYGGLTVVISVLLRGETLTPLQAIGAALATLGVIMTGLVFDGGWRGTRLVGQGVLFSLLAMFLFTALTAGLATPIHIAGWLPVLLTSRVANAVTILVVLVIVTLIRPCRSDMLIKGSAFAIGLEIAPTWIVGLASSFGPAVAVIVAVALWGERLRPSQWVGLAGIAAGLVAVALP
jgi:drug/metabolite transporter (DMT)-like permease